MKVLITGVTGFVGSHLADFLLEKEDIEIYGTERWRSRTENIEHIKDRVKLTECDIRDASSVKKLIENIKPDKIFHLAAQSFVLTSWHAPQETLTTNIIGELNVFEAVRELGINPIIQIAGSSEEYGLVEENELPVKETNPLRPLSPYAVSKVGQDLLGYQYYKSYGLNIVRTRGFNHSISKDTPVLVKFPETSLLDILEIEDIRRCRKKVRQELWEDLELEVWDGDKFTPILNMSAHPIRQPKEIRIINIHQAAVKVTEGHSLIDKYGNEVRADTISKEDELYLNNFPELSKLTKVNNDLAWFYGFFIAEGSIVKRKNKDQFRIKISNKNPDLIKRCQRIILENFGLSCSINAERDGIFSLRVKEESYLLGTHRSPATRLANYLRGEIYTHNGFKRIPRIILNSTKETCIGFLRGFNQGDGLVASSYSPKREFRQFTTESPTLCLGLCYLVHSALGLGYSVSYEDRRDKGYYHIYIHSQNPGGEHLEKKKGIVKKHLVKEYKDAVYDIETESHRFMAGGVVVHNTGPRRGEVFVCSDFAKQIAKIEKKKQEPVISVGNLEAIRDFTDVRDMVKAYWLATEKVKPGEVYNICSGKGWKIKEVLDILLSLTKEKIEVKQDPKKMRPSDVPVLIGDSTKFRKATGWKPEIPFEKTLEDLLNYWRERT
jgi:GDP-D-mannose dehydratase